MNLTKITDSTPVHDFPTIYNGNVDELIKEIDDLHQIIDAKDREIETLKRDINSVLNKFRAEYLKMFEELNNKDN